VRTALAQLSTRLRISASSVDLLWLVLILISLIEIDKPAGFVRRRIQFNPGIVARFSAIT
jgi:hypothetical protein